MSDAFIRAEHVYFEYPSDTTSHQSAICDVSLEVHRGEFVAVLGHNGSGKSTLAKLFNGILVPTRGSVTVDSLSTEKEDNLLEIRKRIGMVFQNPNNQLVSTVVEEDVAFGPENLGVPQTELRTRVDEALKAVDMFAYKNHAPHALSGGQKQRVAIAGVLAMQPECIVFDESTAMLDPTGRKEILATIRHLNRTLGMTIILITHYMDEAVEADRVLVMNDGQIAMDDVPQKVFSEVDTLWKLGLDVPQATEILHLLAGHERVRTRMTLPRGVLDESEAAGLIRKLLETRKQ